MSIQINKQEYTVFVECDKCSVFQEYDSDDSLPFIMKDLVNNHNWKIIDNHIFLCPNCSNKYNNIWNNLRDEKLLQNKEIKKSNKYIDYEDEQEDLYI